jgi:hypothetical protein
MKKLFLAPAVVIALALAGCTHPEPVDEHYEGELTDSDSKVDQDNSRYDTYTFEADEGWSIDITMHSDAFDSYLWLIGPSETSLAQDDDGAHQGKDSRITTTAPDRGTYTIRANSYDGSGRGAYTVHVTAHPPASNPNAS